MTGKTEWGERFHPNSVIPRRKITGMSEIDKPIGQNGGFNREVEKMVRCVLVLAMVIVIGSCARKDNSDKPSYKPPGGYVPDAQTATNIDMKQVRQILQKHRRGETLTDEEAQLLKKGMALREQRNRKGRDNTQRPKNQGREAKARTSTAGKESFGFKPLSELGEEKYKGQEGGLYGNGSNEPPAEHQKAALKELSEIKPLGSQGNCSEQGKIVFISIGMSNTTQEFSGFEALAKRDPSKSPFLEIVDCAQGGMEALAWAGEFIKNKNKDPWQELERRIKKRGFTLEQVQVAWVKLAVRTPDKYGGEFPGHIDKYKSLLVQILNKMKAKLPNLKIAYLSNRIYAGYATTRLNPEPYAYEYGFGIRDLILKQVQGDGELNYNSENGEVNAPLLLWGPDLWADGIIPRKSDGLIWERKDLSGDGTHPSRSGKEKVVKLLLNFFKNDPLAKSWFVKPKSCEDISFIIAKNFIPGNNSPHISKNY